MTNKVMSAKIVAIRFQPIGKVYHFGASKVADIKIGDYVLVSTSRGKELGQVVSFITNRPDLEKEGVKAIERLATAQEMVMRRIWQERELEALINCREQAAKLGLRGVKFAKAEFSYDGKRLTFLYSVEGDESPQKSIFLPSFLSTLMPSSRISSSIYVIDQKKDCSRAHTYTQTASAFSVSRFRAE